jgi:hypothetical protein
MEPLEIVRLASVGARDPAWPRSPSASRDSSYTVSAGPTQLTSNQSSNSWAARADSAKRRLASKLLALQSDCESIAQQPAIMWIQSRTSLTDTATLSCVPEITGWQGITRSNSVSFTTNGLVSPQTRPVNSAAGHGHRQSVC